MSGKSYGLFTAAKKTTRSPSTKSIGQMPVHDVLTGAPVGKTPFQFDKSIAMNEPFTIMTTHYVTNSKQAMAPKE
ncbi:hypothetical protein RRF57_013299 [Xylaria bambusicola]|uniref:Uncharacterized protein n=1 Tax=Xylaria bambusicola TaxID=326684 RepID=A0AAN7UZ61_9PEZI